mmetsp:Transcript_43841/g.86964  ORF Transcript_43841/g.86964 Transcript_43841/m.86964 type:complete len:218 (+) Transcript_43841:662-1315(+)
MRGAASQFQHATATLEPAAKTIPSTVPQRHTQLMAATKRMAIAPLGCSSRHNTSAMAAGQMVTATTFQRWALRKKTRRRPSMGILVATTKTRPRATHPARMRALGMQRKHCATAPRRLLALVYVRTSRMRPPVVRHPLSRVASGTHKNKSAIQNKMKRRTLPRSPASLEQAQRMQNSISGGWRTSSGRPLSLATTSCSGAGTTSRHPKSGLLARTSW